MAKVMNVVFGIGIAVILYLVVLLGIRAFYPEPMLDNYNCSSYYAPYQVLPEQICAQNMTVAQCNELQKNQSFVNEQRDKDSQNCYTQFDKDQRAYGKILFIITAILGSIAIVVSFSLLSMTNIAAGVALSGIALIIYGFARGWQSSGDTLKFIIGLLAAVVVFVFAVKVNKHNSKVKKK